MKALTVRLPNELVAQIETEARQRKLSKSDVVREWLTRGLPGHGNLPLTLDAISDLIGSVDGLPPDLSANAETYFRSVGHGVRRSR